MAMNSTYLNLIANAGRSAITHIGLVNASGSPVGAARKPVTWTAASDGDFAPTADLVFDMTAGDVVAGWRGYSALTGGTDYDGQALAQITYANDGTYTLQAALTSIAHNAS